MSRRFGRLRSFMGCTIDLVLTEDRLLVRWEDVDWPEVVDDSDPDLFRFRRRTSLGRGDETVVVLALDGVAGGVSKVDAMSSTLRPSVAPPGVSVSVWLSSASDMISPVSPGSSRSLRASNIRPMSACIPPKSRPRISFSYACKQTHTTLMNPYNPAQA